MRILLPLLAIGLTVGGCGLKRETPVNSEEARSAIESENRQRPTFPASVGEEATQTGKGLTVDPAELGVKTYPGSTPANGGRSDSRMVSRGETLLIVVRETSDSPEKVAEFYKKELQSSDAYATSEMAALSGSNPAGDSVLVSAVRDKGAAKTQVTVSVSKKSK